MPSNVAVPRLIPCSFLRSKIQDAPHWMMMPRHHPPELQLADWILYRFVHCSFHWMGIMTWTVSIKVCSQWNYWFHPTWNNVSCTALSFPTTFPLAVGYYQPMATLMDNDVCFQANHRPYGLILRLFGEL